MTLHPISLCLVVAILWLPSVGVAGDVPNQSIATQETPPKSGTPSASKEKPAKKPDQNDVQSRGLFQKKKKKQKGGSAGHSQTGEQTEAPVSKP
jgi:hypothetical protein